MEEGSFAFCVLAFTFSGKSVYSVLLLVRLSAHLPSLSPSLPPAYTEDQQQLSESYLFNCSTRYGRHPVLGSERFLHSCPLCQEITIVVPSRPQPFLYKNYIPSVALEKGEKSVLGRGTYVWWSRGRTG